MKISTVKKGNQVASNQKLDKASPATGASFSDLLSDQRERQDREQLEKMMLAIRKQGELLVDAKHIDVLVSYKKMVKDFVSQAVEFAFSVQERRGLSRMGRSKVLKVVSQIDNELVAITEAFLSEERTRIKLLNRIGELQGLMMNLYV